LEKIFSSSSKKNQKIFGPKKKFAKKIVKHLNLRKIKNLDFPKIEIFEDFFANFFLTKKNRFFFELEENIFSKLKKNPKYSFDAKIWYLSISDISTTL